jgi:hypothetical protein
MNRLAIAAWVLLLLPIGNPAPSCGGDAPGGKGNSAMPPFRVEADGFGAKEADIRAIIQSAGSELWRHFPEYRIEPIVVTRGHNGPITLYQRNEPGEIVVRLDTGKTYWAQYSYQFAHEFCHILCGYRKAYEGNKWFEETVCETASLYVLRAMSRSWKTEPPYPNWRDYRDALREYADDVIRKREEVYAIDLKGLPAFYQLHKATLEKNPTSRELDGAMAVILLRLFEEQPQRWESIRWLNSNPPRAGDTFQTYLQKWHDAAPPRHQAFIRKIGQLYGVTLTPG